MKKEYIYYLIIALGIASVGWWSSTTNQNVTPTRNYQPSKHVSIKNIPLTVIATTTPERSGVIDEHLTINNELRDVNFCGKIYKVKQVLIDGVDVVQRVAELATNNLIPSTFEKGPLLTKEEQAVDKVIMRPGTIALQICENVRLNTRLGKNIEISVKNTFNGADIGLPGEKIYPVRLEQLFYISIPSENIYINDDFSGTPIGSIGKLK